MGTIKTTNIETITGSGTLTLGQSGETVNIPSGVTITNNGTQTGFGGTNTPAFLAYRSGSNFSLPNAAYTKVIFNSEKFDTASAYDTSTGVFTVPSGQAGKYFLGGQLFMGGASAPRFILRMMKNGGTLIFMDGEKTAPCTAFASTVASLSVGDTIQIDGNQTSGSAQGLDFSSSAEVNYFFGYKIIE